VQRSKSKDQSEGVKMSGFLEVILSFSLEIKTL